MPPARKTDARRVDWGRQDAAIAYLRDNPGATCFMASRKFNVDNARLQSRIEYYYGSIYALRAGEPPILRKTEMIERPCITCGKVARMRREKRICRKCKWREGL